MDNLLQIATSSLSLTCNTGSLHPSDTDRIKITLKALYHNKVSIEPELLESQLTERGWNHKEIIKVKNWAEAIQSGRKVLIKHKSSAPKERDVWAKLIEKQSVIQTNTAP